MNSNPPYFYTCVRVCSAIFHSECVEMRQTVVVLLTNVGVDQFRAEEICFPGYFSPQFSQRMKGRGRQLKMDLQNIREDM